MKRQALKDEIPVPPSVRKWYALIGAKGGRNGSAAAKAKAGTIGCAKRWAGHVRKTKPRPKKVAGAASVAARTRASAASRPAAPLGDRA